jgi:aspartate kinase
MPVREVWKFGGTGVDSADKRGRIGRRVAAAADLELVLVVSAAAGETDRLLREIAGDPGVPQDVIDAFVATGEMRSAAHVAAAVHSAGRPAEVVPATHLLECDGTFGDAAVVRADVSPLLDRLRRGVVPVVGGFFGRNPDGRTCLLGRGGSDYSAVLLGAALGCEVVLHKADCDGVYDADPNGRPGARRFDRLTHEQAAALSRGGAKVLNAKAARAALRHGVPVVVRPAFHDGPGTRIASAGLNGHARTGS